VAPSPVVTSPGASEILNHWKAPLRLTPDKPGRINGQWRGPCPRCGKPGGLPVKPGDRGQLVIWLADCPCDEWDVYPVLKSLVPSAPAPRKPAPGVPPPAPAAELAALRKSVRALALNDAFPHSVPIRLALLELAGYETAAALDVLVGGHPGNRRRAVAARSTALAGARRARAPKRPLPAETLTSESSRRSGTSTTLPAETLTSEHRPMSAEGPGEVVTSGNGDLTKPATVVTAPRGYGYGYEDPGPEQTEALGLLASMLGAEVIGEHSADGRCDARGCTEPARDCGTGTYCQRHARMLGAAWPETVIPAAAA